MLEFIIKNDVINTNIKSQLKTSLRNNITESYHSNYMGYLEFCYKNHHGIIIKPDYLWYTILCEISQHIKDNSKTYQHLFTDSDNKKEITITCLDMEVMDIKTLFNALLNVIPSKFNHADINLGFSTSNKNDINAFRIAFLDAMSCYYDYSMQLCGFNKIKVLGDITDYSKITEGIKFWINIFQGHSEILNYLNNCKFIIGDLLIHFNDVNHWNEILTLEKCGSGSQVIVNGWFTGLYMKYPRVGYSKNFNTHVSRIEYKQLNTGKRYEMIYGLFQSNIEEDYLIPDFGFYVNEIQPAKEKLFELYSYVYGNDNTR